MLNVEQQKMVQQDTIINVLEEREIMVAIKQVLEKNSLKIYVTIIFEE